MKKITLGLLTAMATVIIAGCSGGSTETDNDSVLATQNDISTEVTESVSWKTFEGISTTKDEWDSDPLLVDIPYPELDYISINYESSSWIDIYAYQVTLSQFKKYANACKSAGFTADMLLNDYMFMGYKDEDTSIVLGYNSDTGVLEISYYFTK